jgi:hypothetical protein
MVGSGGGDYRLERIRLTTAWQLERAGILRDYRRLTVNAQPQNMAGNETVKMTQVAL